MQDWEQVRLFLAVTRGGSLAGAAARLGVDVSTVSRRLDRLEEEVGAPVFDRTRDGTTPTSLGEQLLAAAERMELAAIEFGAEGAKVETEVEGVVRITVPPGIADAFVAPRLARLHARHPRLVIELDASVGYADLTRREADIAIRALRPTGGDLVVTKLVTARAAPLASVAYARKLGPLRRFEDARWITWDRDLAHLPDGAWLRRHGAAAPIVLRTSHFASQLAAARAGLGIVLAAEPFARDGLVAVKPGRALKEAWADLPSGSLWLVGHRALRHVPRVAAAWSFVLETFGAG
ncbi:MAG: LysR family transcriptional regulator [Labilithrix sp.]|nr:LysR family transcriptional regulator [Labilithrix sp.]MCW5813617.1 LysR family transcriptional regulator [Labilithrix sp.]